MMKSLVKLSLNNAYHEAESRGLGGLGQRLASRSSLLEQEPRLPLPTPQDIEAIKKVAQILVMLGEQHNTRNQEQIDMLNRIVDTLRPLGSKPARKLKYVIPGLVGDSGAVRPPAPAVGVVEEIPNDPVEV